MDHLFYLCLVFALLSRLFIAALWSSAEKGLPFLALFVMFNCVFVTFSCYILGQVWYLIVSIPDLCHLSYFLSRQKRFCMTETFHCLLKFGPRREKTCLRGVAKNTGADKPAHPRSLISAFVNRFLESFLHNLATGEISIF